MIDFQQYKVYSAERRAFAEHNNLMSWREAAVLTREWAKVWGIELRAINVLSENSKWGGQASPWNKSICYPSRGATRWIIAHELAHHLANDRHGPVFCAWYLRLVQNHIGKYADETLRKEMIKEGVQIGTL